MPLDRLAAAGDPQLRRILMYARGLRDPFTAADAAEALGMHSNVARNRLDRLVGSGFLSVRFERPGGRGGPGAGRPAKVYRVAPELETVEFPDRYHVELISLMASKLPAKALREAGEDYGRALAAGAGLRPARRIAAGLERLCDALGSLGFQASVVAVEEDRAELAATTCPLRPLVVHHPDAGGIDGGMWAGLVEGGVRGLSASRVACETPSCLSTDGSCSVLLSFGSRR